MPNPYNTYEVPVSVKGIVIEEGAVWLRRNERDEWELPGGKMDAGEQPVQTAKREMAEELGLDVTVGDIVQAYLYVIDSSLDEDKGVLVVSYLCAVNSRIGEFEWEGEAGNPHFQKFALHEIEVLNMPDFYKEAIRISFSKIRN